MRMCRFLAIWAVAAGLFILPIYCSFAAEPKTVKIGSTVALKSKEGVQIKKWLELLAERLNGEGGLIVKGERYNVQMVIYDDDLTVEVVAQFFVHQRRPVAQSVFHVYHRIEGVDVNDRQLGRILGDIPALRHNDGNRFADEADYVKGQ